MRKPCAGNGTAGIGTLTTTNRSKYVKPGATSGRDTGIQFFPHPPQPLCKPVYVL
jgi:hypothetical protein